MLRTTSKSLSLSVWAVITLGLLATGTLSQLNTSVADTEAKETRENFCEGIEVNYTMMTDQEIEIQRNKDINLFHKSTDLLKELIKTKDYTLIFDGTLWLPIFITVIFAFSLISLILYLFNIFICCKRTKTSSASFCFKLNICFAVTALLVFLLAIIAMSIFISNARSSIKYVNCSFNIMNDDLRNGAEYSEANLKFQGLASLQKIFTSYGTTLNSLINDHVDNINDIVGKNVPTLAKSAVESVEPFYNTYKDKTTSNVNGQMEKPNSVTNILPGGKIAMDDEFTKLYTASLSVHEAALVAKSVIDQGDSAIFESAINSAVKEIESILDAIGKYINVSNDYFGTISDDYDALQVSYIVFNFLCLIVAIVIIVGLCSIFHRDKCKVFLVWRILIFIIGILCVLFFVATLVISGLSFATSSACTIFSELHTDEGIDDFVETFEISDHFKTILKTCYSEEASGDLGQVFLEENSTNSPEFQIYNDSKTLLSIYEKYDAQTENVDPLGNSTSTQNLDDALEKVRIGINQDFTEVSGALVSLNTYVNCDNFYYALTPNTCSTSNLTCETIQGSSVLKVPTCLTGQGTVKVSEATDLFNKLKAYLTDTQALMASMIDDTNGAKTSSLNSKYKVAALAFLESADLFDKVKEDQKDTLAMFNGDLNQQTDCRIIRLHLQIIEDAICFNVVGELYAFMVASLIGSIFFFCFVWNLCCAEYCLWNELEGEDEEEEIETYENKEAKPIIMPTEPNNDVAEDDFFINNAQGGYIGDSDSVQPQDKNIEYKEEAKEDDFMAPNTVGEKGKVE